MRFELWGMSDIIRKGSAVWSGDLKSGRGRVSTQSGALKDNPYGFTTRFEGEPGTNPEELIAAAHASCFSMALSMILGQDGNTPEEIRTSVAVRLARAEGGFKVTAIHIDVTARVPGLDEEGFSKAAQTAKENCPISKLLAPGLDELTMKAALG